MPHTSLKSICRTELREQWFIKRCLNTKISYQEYLKVQFWAPYSSECTLMICLQFVIMSLSIQIYLSHPIGLIENLVSRINEDIAILDWSEANDGTPKQGRMQAILFSKKEYETDDLPSLFLRKEKVPFLNSVSSFGFKVSSNLLCSQHINLTWPQTWLHIWVQNVCIDCFQWYDPTCLRFTKVWSHISHQN